MLPTSAWTKPVVAAALALAVAAPGASARDAEPSAAPSKADMIARREALATKAWLAANPPKIVEVSPADDGFDLPSAAIGAAIPLTVIVLEVAGRSVLRRRRDSKAEQLLA